MDLYRHSGIKSVFTESASVKVVSVTIEQVPLKKIWMGIELFAGTTGILFANLAQIMLCQVHQHVFPVLESGLTLGTRMSDSIVSMISLKVSGQMFSERFKVL